MKHYWHFYGVEGAQFKSLYATHISLPELKAKAARKDPYLLYDFNSGYTLGWLVDYDLVEIGKTGKPLIARFFRSLKMKPEDKRWHNYSHPKIAGFCDLKAPERTSGILKKLFING